MRFRGRVKSVFGISLALVMAMSLIMSAFTALAAADTGSITLTAPSNEDGSKVELKGMTVTAYQILDETAEGDGMFIVNENFANFFKEATDTFYGVDFGKYVENGAAIEGKKFYITYDSSVGSEGLRLSSEKPVSGDIIEVSVSDLQKLVLNIDNEEFFPAALMEAILKEGRIIEGEVHSNTPSTKKLAEWLEKYIKAQNITPGPGETVTATEKQESIKLDGLSLGYWLLVSSNAPANVANVEAVFRLSKLEDSVNAQLKLETQSVEKTVENVTTTGGKGTSAPSTDAQVGDILKYQAKMRIPDLSAYDGSNLPEGKTVEDYKYVITDTMKNQQLVTQSEPHTVITNQQITDDGKNFTLDAFEITIDYEVGGDVKSVKLKDLDAPTGGAKKLVDQLNTTDSSYGQYKGKTQTFVLDFSVEKLRELQESTEGVGVNIGNWNDATLTLTYYARLTSDAVLQNGNEVKLEYSNDPHSDITPTVPTEKTTVYSYGFDLTKKFEGMTDGITELLENVTFQLFSPKSLDELGTSVKEWETTPLNVVGADGDYTLAVGDEADPAPTAVLQPKSTDGHLKVYGLKEGYYKLVETKSPKGYARIKEIIIYVSADENDGKRYDVDATKVTEGNVNVTFTTDNEAPELSHDNFKNYIHFDVENMKGMNLPETGGLGFWMILIGGVVLIALAGAMLVAGKKKDVE